MRRGGRCEGGPSVNRQQPSTGEVTSPGDATATLTAFWRQNSKSCKMTRVKQNKVYSDGKGKKELRKRRVEGGGGGKEWQ
jgi:hypothetical protein